MAMTQITVTGYLKDANNQPASGFVTFTLTKELQDQTSNVVVTRQPIRVGLGTVDGVPSPGHFKTQLYATSGDAGVVPTDAQYVFAQHLVDGTPESESPRSFALPAASPNPSDIADLLAP